MSQREFRLRLAEALGCANGREYAARQAVETPLLIQTIGSRALAPVQPKG